MSEIVFQWDENKNVTNKKKHGISFEEAQTVFYDEEALLIDDPEHSKDEERFII
ncbi:BrnT family toxin [Pumilibacter muris]|uniref:BrnT family toxin n=1 Tax=Pumilibacter muris TaxID=2941510 RepID=UPI0030845207